MGNKKNRAKANGGSDLFALRLRLCRCISQPTQQRLRFFRDRKNSSVLSNINTGSLLSESSKIVKMRNRENRAKPNGGLDRHYGSHSGTALHHHSDQKLLEKQKSTHLLTFALPTFTRLRNFGSIYFLSNGSGTDSVSFGAGIFHLALIVLHVTSSWKAQRRDLFPVVTTSFRNVKCSLQMRGY